MVSHPENGSDSPIGSDRDQGRDTEGSRSREDSIEMMEMLRSEKIF